MIPAGQLRDLVRFDQRDEDANGDRLGPWLTTGTPQPARLEYLRGSEPVMQARLNGVQPVVITVRDCAAVRVVSTGWRAYDVRASVAYDIKGVAPTKGERGFLDITAVSQGGNG